ncbi:MAG: tRNA pseudouridine(38-40) synthase TruA [Pirellulaceae bacterium]
MAQVSDMRYLKLTIAYDGTDYVGWQVQPNGVSIQQRLEEAWQNVTRESIRIIASGRTDAGVHALGQVCSLTTESALPVERIQAALNAHLPADIRVSRIDQAAVNFHAIRDARFKTYRYQLQSGPLVDLFSRRYCWFVRGELDIAAMQAAAGYLIGTHDYSSFEATGAPRQDSIRTITHLDVCARQRHGFEFMDVEITADGFLYNMVRNIVGTLVITGQGKQETDWVTSVLAGKDRSLAGATAPAHGLFLVSVAYGD